MLRIVCLARVPAARLYDALAANNSALEVMGKDNLKVIATELVTQVRRSVTID